MKNEADKRKRTIAVRLTPAEYEAAHRVGKGIGLSISSFTRLALLTEIKNRGVEVTNDVH